MKIKEENFKDIAEFVTFLPHGSGIESTYAGNVGRGTTITSPETPAIAKREASLKNFCHWATFAGVHEICFNHPTTKPQLNIVLSRIQNKNNNKKMRIFYDNYKSELTKEHSLRS